MRAAAHTRAAPSLTLEIALSNPRIAYELADERAPLAPPGGKPLIVHVVVNVEVWPFDQPMPRGILSPPHGAAGRPNLFRSASDR